MADRAEIRMTAAEFLDWDDGTSTRYMLVDGVVVAMAPPGQRHSRIAGNLARAIGNRARPGCGVLSEAGLTLTDDTCVQADVAYTCEPAGPARLIEAPALPVEVLSRSTRKDDLGVEIPGYKDMPSVLEIWAVDSERRAVRTWRRLPDGQWLESLPMREGVVRSEVLGADVGLDEVYAGVDAA